MGIPPIYFFRKYSKLITVFGCHSEKHIRRINKLDEFDVLQKLFVNTINKNFTTSSSNETSFINMINKYCIPINISVVFLFYKIGSRYWLSVMYVNDVYATTYIPVV